MKPKYKCTLCSRTFIYKETLEEHNRLHGIVIKDGCCYSCPICLEEVVCELKSHRHKNSEIRASTACDLPPERNSFKRSTGKDCSANIVTSQTVWSAPTKISKSGRCSKKTENVEASSEDAATASQCNICHKTFVYLKCLLRHQSSVHGMTAVSPSNGNNNNSSSAVANVGELPEHGSGKKQHCEPSEDSSSSQTNVLTDELGTINHLVINKLAVEKGTSGDRNGMSGSDVSSNTVETYSSKRRKCKVKFTCKLCSKTFKYKTALVRHRRVVHSVSTWDKCSCPICLQSFDSQLTFSRHFDSCHVELVAELLSTLKTSQVDREQVGGVVRCDTCSQWFTCRRSLLKHCGLKHRVIKCSVTGQVRYKCVHCEETFGTNRQLVYHRHNKHYVHKSKNHEQEADVEIRNTVNIEGDMKPNISGDISSSDETIDNVSNADESFSTSHHQKNNEAKYSCKECSKVFASVAFLIRHNKLKHTNGIAAKLNKHTSCKPKKQVFVCGICSEEFSLEEALSDHMDLIHHGYSLDTVECACPICSETFQDQSAFSNHYVVAHCIKSEAAKPASPVDGGNSGDQLPNCKTCGHWFTDRRAMIAHQCPKKLPVRLKPAGRARYRCSQCGEAFEVLRRFLHHRKVKHRMDGPVTSEVSQQLLPAADSDAAVSVSEAADAVKDPMSYCTRGRPPKSSNVFGDNSDAIVPDDSQTNVYENDVPTTARPRLPRGFASGMPTEGSGLKCPECHRSFQTVSQLRKHRKAEHRNRTCQLCGEKCKSADMVYYHNLKYHHEQKCDVCGASCPGRLGLIQHFRAEHPNEPPPLINRKTLICEYCPRVFAGCASRLLRDHIESCHLGRVHLCDVCGKRLGSAQTLAVHRRMHDPVARFACQECNRRFPHNTNLINHIRKHHPERLPPKYAREFRCDVCSMQFGSSSGLTRHRTEKHSSSRHQCDLCLRVFQSVTGLRVHKRREHTQKEVIPSNSLTVQHDSQQVVMVPVTFTADPTMMAGILAGLPGLNHGFS